MRAAAAEILRFAQDYILILAGSENGERCAPRFYFGCVVSEAPKTERVSGRRAPRARCDQLVFRSKPGGVMLPSVAT